MKNSELRSSPVFFFTFFYFLNPVGNNISLQWVSVGAKTLRKDNLIPLMDSKRAEANSIAFWELKPHGVVYKHLGLLSTCAYTRILSYLAFQRLKTEMRDKTTRIAD